MQVQKKIIISRLLASAGAASAFLFDPEDSANLRARPDILIFDSWELKSEHQILVRAALDIWNGSGNVFLWELLNGLNPQNFSRLIVALKSYQDLRAQSGEFGSWRAEKNL